MHLDKSLAPLLNSGGPITSTYHAHSLSRTLASAQGPSGFHQWCSGGHSKRRKWKEPCASIYTRELLQAERADPYPTHTTAPVFSITQVKDLECKDSPQPQSFIINISLQVQIPMKSDSPGRREGQGLAVSLC